MVGVMVTAGWNVLRRVLQMRNALSRRFFRAVQIHEQKQTLRGKPVLPDP